MTASDRRFGTNALDAISHMNRFSARLDATELLTWDNRKVLIVINGVPTDGFDLRSYKADQIKYVEYYTVAPPKYAMLTDGPVVDVIIKRPHDRQIAASFNTSNAITSGFGTNQTNLSYTDSLNSVRIGYMIDYRDTHDISQRSEYDYGSFMTKYNLNGRYCGTYQNVNASYQRYQGKHFFVARLNVTPEHGMEHYAGAGTLDITGNGVLGINNDQWRRSSSQLYSANLYYHYRFSDSRLLAVNVVNSLGRSKAYSGIFQTYDDLHDYDINTEYGLRNKTYSLVAQVFYNTILWGNSLQVASSYSYSRISQDAAMIRSVPHDHNVHAYASYTVNGKCNVWTVTPLIGLTVWDQHTGISSSTYVNPVATLYAGYY